MEQRTGQQPSLPQRPLTNDRSMWQAYWQAQGDLYRSKSSHGIDDEHVWRTEPEIDVERRSFLAERLEMIPDIEGRTYPFKGLHLSRADLEWLIAFQRGYLQSSPEPNATSSGGRASLDLRGADMSSEDLSHLPLSGLLGGLTEEESITATEEEEEAAAIHLENSKLLLTQLQGAQLCRARFDGAYLQRIRLQNADLRHASLVRADLRAAHLEAANMSDARFEGADLVRAHLEGCELPRAHFESSDLILALLQGANLREAHFDGADLHRAHLEGANIDLAYFNNATSLGRLNLAGDGYGIARMLDVHWGDANLTVIDWGKVNPLQLMRNTWVDRRRAGRVRPRSRLEREQEAVRTCRQLVTVLQDQGLYGDAARFSYCAHVLQRNVLFQQCRFGSYLLSWLLFLLAGYGYKPFRIALWYIAIVGLCALVYGALGASDPLIESVAAFHGRGFFPDQLHLNGPAYEIAAAEAVVGLLIEISFIATVSPRFFGRTAEI